MTTMTLWGGPAHGKRVTVPGDTPPHAINWADSSTSLVLDVDPSPFGNSARIETYTVRQTAMVPLAPWIATWDGAPTPNLVRHWAPEAFDAYRQAKDATRK